MTGLTEVILMPYSSVVNVALVLWGAGHILRNGY